LKFKFHSVTRAKSGVGVSVPSTIVEPHAVKVRRRVDRVFAVSRFKNRASRTPTTDLHAGPRRMRQAHKLDIDVDLIGERRNPIEFVDDRAFDHFGLNAVGVATKQPFDVQFVANDQVRIGFVANDRAEEQSDRLQRPGVGGSCERRLVEVDMRCRDRRHATVTRRVKIAK
jgi:hypothetical protein